MSGKRHIRGHALVVIGGVPLLIFGCMPSTEPSFESGSPNARLEAIAAASNLSDDESLGKLIAQLDSDDPAARMLAITALRKRTGETLGFESSDPDWRRREALERWDEFLAERLGEGEGEID